MKDRRNYPRVTCNVRISVREAADAKVKNISECGICITTHVLLPRGKPIILTFTLPDGEKINVNGNVAWSIPGEAGQFENGIDFLAVNTHYRKILSGFLN